jgi:hypothetical protein
LQILFILFGYRIAPASDAQTQNGGWVGAWFWRFEIVGQIKKVTW